MSVHKKNIALFLILLMLGAYLSCRRGIESVFDPPPLPRGVPLLHQGVTLVPESDRPLDFFIMGLNPEWETNFMLTDELRKKGFNESQLSEVDRNLYWLNFELSHGAVMRFLPDYTHLFVAVPRLRNGKVCSGREESFFREYLRVRCQWPEKRIRENIQFFCSPESLVWAQDIGEILGRDTKNRAVIDVGSTGPTTKYRSTIRTLAETFPKHFALKVLPEGINAEGGDEEIVWTPEGKPALLVGRHRIQAFLEYRDGESYNGRPADPLAIAEARQAFSRAFYDLPVIIVPEAVLEKPALGHVDLFHLDMITTVLHNHRHIPHAFVPTYESPAADSALDLPLKRNYISAVQREYDLAADQLDEIGYQVIRLPFADHPVRGPVNFVKYYDRDRDRVVVLLPRYTYHLPHDSLHPRKRIQIAMTLLDDKAFEWHERRDPSSYQAYLEAIQNLWNEMESAQKEPNPIFERQAALIRKAGYDVIGIPTYAWGSGGLHCQILR